MGLVLLRARSHGVSNDRPNHLTTQDTREDFQGPRPVTHYDHAMDDHRTASPPTRDGLAQRIDRALRQYPERPCLLLPDGTRSTYGDLLAWSSQIATRLVEAGVAPGDRVAVQVEKSPMAVALYLGCLRAGGIYLPLNPAYRPAEVGYFLNDAEPRVFVADPAHARSLAPHVPAGTVVLTLDADGHGSLCDSNTARAAAARSSTDVSNRAGADVAAIVYTSGTTGRAKGAMLTHDNLLSNADTLIDLWGFSGRDTLIHALPIYHVHGLFVALHCVLLSGARAHFLPRFDADAVLDLLARSTVLMGVPTFYTRLLAHPGLDHRGCRAMRLFISGSAPLRAEDFDAFRERTGYAILERYGMTEAGMITSNPLDGTRRAGTVGRPLPGVETRVVDPDRGLPVDDGAVGVLHIRGPNVFAGYWRQPDKTRAEHDDAGFFITGDLVTRAADGTITIVGRAKDLVISGGLNVYPKEVEQALDALAGVGESAVVGLPHPDLGEAVVAAVVPAPGQGLDPDALRQALRANLAAFKVPKHIAVVDTLPRNAMGKVQKNRLREKLGEGLRWPTGESSS